MPILQKYGEDYYCVDCVCDNTADYEMQYENASNAIVNNEVKECEFERNAGGDRVAMEVNKRVEQKDGYAILQMSQQKRTKKREYSNVLTGFCNTLYSRIHHFINRMNLME